jgi:hypothetical protein
VARHARSSIDLEGLMLAEPAPPERPEGAGGAGHHREHPMVVHVPRVSDEAAAAALGEPLAGALHVRLAREAYVPTEQPWGDGNAPHADVWIGGTATLLVVRVAVFTGHDLVTPGGSPATMPENPLDNERADVNADGVQCHLRGVHDAEWCAGILAVPVAPPAARVTSLVPNGAVPDVSCAARADGGGWYLQMEWRRDRLSDPETVHLDLVINERPPERERRRGQLVLSGGGGFGYLAGDRHAVSRGWRLQLP